MSFLARLSQLKKPVGQRTNDRPEKKVLADTQVDSLRSESSLLPKHYVREEDPAVKRLKEFRRQQQLKNGPPKKKASAPSNKRRRTDESAATEAKFKRKIGTNVKRPVAAAAAREPLKKLSFDELMKEAENRAQKSPVRRDPAAPDIKSRGRKPTLHVPGFKTVRPKKLIPKHKTPPMKKEEKMKIQLSLAKPTLAQPSDKLRKKLDLLKKHRHDRGFEDDDDDENLDGFIDDDEEEPNYDRDEIWAMFNKGKRRRDYQYSDDESDNMEANEFEILEEEEQARRMAKLEDKREDQWLKRHEEEKRRKSNQK